MKNGESNVTNNFKNCQNTTAISIIWKLIRHITSDMSTSLISSEVILIIGQLIMFTSKIFISTCQIILLNCLIFMSTAQNYYDK